MFKKIELDNKSTSNNWRNAKLPTFGRADFQPIDE